MRPDHAGAVESQLHWLGWAQRNLTNRRLDEPFRIVLPAYLNNLRAADTFTMTQQFWQLVENHRRSTPDNLAFDVQWLQAKSGFLMLPQPFKVPPIIAMRNLNPSMSDEEREIYCSVHAMGWQQIPTGATVSDNARSHGSQVTTVAGPGTWQLLFYQSRAGIDPPSSPLCDGFNPWSYLIVRDGELLGPRVEKFEAMNGEAGDGAIYERVPGDEILHPMHEIRWAYTVLFLMAQRLAVTCRVRPDRAERRRIERSRPDIDPIFKVITLRRLAQPRDRQATAEAVDWQCQWEVAGHWRQQFYPSEGIHKPKFIDAFIKGPPDKPLKRAAKRIYSAER